MQKKKMLTRALAVVALGVTALVTTPSVSSARVPFGGCDKCLNSCPADASIACTNACGAYDGGVCYDDGCTGDDNKQYNSSLYCYGAS